VPRDFDRLIAVQIIEVAVDDSGEQDGPFFEPDQGDNIRGFVEIGIRRSVHHRKRMNGPAATRLLEAQVIAATPEAERSRVVLKVPAIATALQ